MKFIRPRLAGKTWAVMVALVLLGLMAVAYAVLLTPERAIVLLVQDKTAMDHPVTHAWIDAAREEGFSLVVMTDDEFMRFSGNRRAVAGVIVPDTVHRRASDLLIQLLESYVSAGGKIFLTFDAGLMDAHNGTYVGEQSRFSRLAGVRYGMYKSLREKSIGLGPVYGSRQSEAQLGFQPGRLDFKYSDYPDMGELSTYGYPKLNHNYFRTEANPIAKVLLRTFENDVVVSQHPFDKGTVLFVNLPLGYLKTRTDSYLLHRLLGYFCTDVLQQPRLAPVPNAQGGLVLNVHIDSNAAPAPLLQMESAGWFDDGPFSLHVTAGPDNYRVGDGTGLNLDANPAMQSFFKRQVARGHEVGSHGGWAHNLFGESANENNRAEFEPYLMLNHRSVSAVLGSPARTYSAPVGNHPVWATQWLERNGFKAYYYTGDVGLGPTRSYYEGKRPQRALWAFPLSNYLKIATFEELETSAKPLSGGDIGLFLTQLSSHVAERHVARLFYFHPPGVIDHYTKEMNGFMAEAQRLAVQGKFRWYTMERLADFMTRRETAQWHMKEGARGVRVLEASNAAGLNELSWIFPHESASRFKVLEGQASVRKEGHEWIVTAGKCTTLEVSIE